MNVYWIRIVFIVAAVYDGLLGAAFLLFGSAIFRSSGVTPPNNFGYVQFPAVLLIIFGIMFLQVALDPARNRSLMLYGVGLKAAYSGLVFWHDLNGGVPSLWLPWAWADLAFLIVFVIAWQRTRPRGTL